MTQDQGLILAILAGAVALFVWGRWRYDVVAFAALMLAVLVGLVPAGAAFVGFGHPAVITVASVLVISQALRSSGVLDLAAKQLGRLDGREGVHAAALAGLAAVLSAFMNNVGALALIMPLAIQTSRNPSLVLMPIAFGSMLGGLTTLIGTPPNIIIATYRESVAGAHFGLFDFAPVGLAVAAVGLAYVVFLGWRFIPQGRRAKRAPEDLFEIETYVAEVAVPKTSKAVGESVNVLEEASEGAVQVIGLVRRGQRRMGALHHERLEARDVVVVEAAPEDLDKLVAALGLTLAGEKEGQKIQLGADDVGVMEVVVPPGARAEGRTADGLRLRARHGVNLLGVARQGKSIRQRLRRARLRAGDVLLLQGDLESLPDTVAWLGCLPLAARGLRIGRRRRMFAPAAIFGAALVATATGLLPVQIAFGLVVVVLIATGLLSAREAYDSIDWPVIVLLAAMIPLGNALAATGATATLAVGVAGLADWAPPLLILAAVLIVTMTLSDVMNNAATAVVMAPIAVEIARQLGLSPDPFLMAVAIGASCAFLTPIGHQNNVLVMGPGGYHFGDYWRMGLPLEVLVVAVAVPMIAVVWPL